VNYTVELDAFSGPLDLLLRLIERAELDITVIALAEVAESYLQYVRAMPSVEAAELADFVALAARLLLIKSRALLPRPPVVPADSGEAVDDAEDLAQQLQQYRRFRQAADLLREREAAGLRHYARLIAPQPLLELMQDVTDDAERLVSALARCHRRTAPVGAAPTMLNLRPRLTVRELVQRIVQALLLQGGCRFEALLTAAADREEVAVAFWAMLELSRRGVIAVEQAAPFGPLQLQPLALHLAPQLESAA
jgi:segregation and condensation protein A